jgi:hypothetical protein
MKVEKVMSKEDILTLYLNEAPYGGNIYGIEEATKAFFGKEPKDLTLAESAYLAAIPNAPTHYSPYGKYKSELESDHFVFNEEYLKTKVDKMMHSESLVADKAVLQGTLLSDGGYAFGTVDRFYSNTPNLADVVVGGGGKPGSPFAPNLGVPGEANGHNPAAIPDSGVETTQEERSRVQ